MNEAKLTQRYRWATFFNTVALLVIVVGGLFTSGTDKSQNRTLSSHQRQINELVIDTASLRYGALYDNTYPPGIHHYKKGTYDCIRTR